MPRPPSKLTKEERRLKVNKYNADWRRKRVMKLRSKRPDRKCLICGGFISRYKWLSFKFCSPECSAISHQRNLIKYNKEGRLKRLKARKNRKCIICGDLIGDGGTKYCKECRVKVNAMNTARYLDKNREEINRKTRDKYWNNEEFRKKESLRKKIWYQNKLKNK